MQSDMKKPLLASSASAASEPLSRGPGGPVIGIIGSGDFSRSLAIRLLASGFRAVVGSRDPTRISRDLFPDGVELRSQREAVERAERVVFAAVYPEHYHTLVGLRERLAGKVLVDVSSASRLNSGEQSNAESLAELFPESRVVKGFNVISAWEMQTGFHDGGRQVLICGDCSDSKAAVLHLARCMGFGPMDLGGLRRSRDIEEVPLSLFPSWGGPILVTFVLFLFFYGYNFLRHILLPYLDQGENNFHQLPLVTFNETLPVVALVTLALVYLPGLVAAVLQLGRGTKYKRFPHWLDLWLCRRKQLGLLSFLCALLHAVYSMCLTLRKAAGYTLLNAAYHQVKAGVENSWVEQQVWRSDLYLSCGILGFGVLSLLAVTSLPSVGNALSWREFTFVQSGLGYAALTLSIMHTLFFGWDFAFFPVAYPYYLPPAYLLALILPCMVLIGRMFLALPCLTLRLAKIRKGWESARHRTPKNQELGSNEEDPPPNFRDV
ncbi:metalloreductase STEAP3 isoform X2 [Toxotes jaculatrix]|nr:metalloreductase STEAP3 isoform X2 [Toxotes jaculatrix]XP_040913517.1 metalloreductase STEAP3 isoform X2 [Toxotes jaculatrix]XP_040913518.1 metalloreductase STEAP3 isoform X2 [Toxotes jaculatrix]XP_040913519.1 metalloreductase STEAP3 isoform X2 [Toxotes jaculatrix]XP_040913520.1 metalloreductase STEAP3 isoform X2 [Toxotes jaculatrix]XP_040913521.1 metalloreductase STEAP3 isoform X2 [Toxotes jaculatrix]